MIGFDNEKVVKTLTEALQHEDVSEGYAILGSTNLVDVGVAFNTEISEDTGKPVCYAKLALHNVDNPDYTYMFDWYAPVVDLESFTIANTERQISSDTVANVIKYFASELDNWNQTDLIK